MLHVAQSLLRWEVERAVSLARNLLRLDCEAERPRVRAIYERFGFQYHSERQVGPCYVARNRYPMKPNET